MHNQFKTQKFKHLMLAMGPRDLNSAPYSPVHCSSHSMTSFQSSELTELPVVENGQLFAQRVHSARYAPIHVGLLRACRYPLGLVHHAGVPEMSKGTTKQSLSKHSFATLANAVENTECSALRSVPACVLSKPLALVAPITETHQSFLFALAPPPWDTKVVASETRPCKGYSESNNKRCTEHHQGRWHGRLSP